MAKLIDMGTYGNFLSEDGGWLLEDNLFEVILALKKPCHRTSFLFLGLCVSASHETSVIYPGWYGIFDLEIIGD